MEAAIKEQVQECISKGKELFKDGNYSEASDEFTKGIDIVDPTYHFFHHPNLHPGESKPDDDDEEEEEEKEEDTNGDDDDDDDDASKDTKEEEEEQEKPKAAEVKRERKKLPLEETSLLIDLLVLRASCYVKEKIFDLAVADCTDAISRNSLAYNAHKVHGEALIGLGRCAEARQALSLAETYYPGSAENAHTDEDGNESEHTDKFLEEIQILKDQVSRTAASQRAMRNMVVRFLSGGGGFGFGNEGADVSDDDSGDVSFGFGVNKKYPDRYDKWWASFDKSTVEIFEELLRQTKDNHVPPGYAVRPFPNESLFIVPEDYAGPRLSRPPTVAEVRGMAEYFKETQQPLLPRYAATILLDALHSFEGLPSLVDVEVPEGTHFTVCGDVHGQFYDLLNIFETNGWPAEDNPYLFNGDFVDRGSFSCEVLLTLFALRAALPHSLFLARGNHETVSMNSMYGFFGEVHSKYHISFETLATEIFNHLPLAHVLAGKIFVVHGGLYTDDALEPPTLDEIRALERVSQPSEDGGPMSELLWSDPQPQDGRAPSRRGAGYLFGPDVTRRFLEKNGLSMVIRSHEVKAAGYEIAHDGLLATVFSAPNYCDRMGNLGAYAKFVAPEMKPEFRTFRDSPHPDVKPMQFANPLFRLISGFL